MSPTKGNSFSANPIRGRKLGRMDRFSHLLMGYVADKQWTLTTFSLKVKRSKNYATGLINKRHKPPLEDLPMWGQVLGLNAAQYAEFEEEAWLVHAPPPLVARYRELKKKLKTP